MMQSCAQGKACLKTQLGKVNKSNFVKNVRSFCKTFLISNFDDATRKSNCVQ